MPDDGSTFETQTARSVVPGTRSHPIESQRLFGELKQVFIRHGDELY